MWSDENAPSEINTYTSTFQNRRGKKIFCKYWETDQKPRGLVFIAHGLAEHCLPYENLARAMVSSGFTVFAHDHVGHGQSGGSRVQIEAFSHFVDDVFQHMELMKKKLSDIPVFLCGHSMGGTISIMTALRKPEDIKGVILIGPAVETNPEVVTPFKLRVTRLLRRTLPQFPIGRLDINMACSCPKNLKKMENDPLRWHGCVKAGFGACFVDALREVQSNLQSITFPIFVLHGEEDKLCLPQGTKTMYEKARSKDKTVKMYPKAFHSLLLEPNGIAEQAIEDIIEWLKLRT